MNKFIKLDIYEYDKNLEKDGEDIVLLVMDDEKAIYVPCSWFDYLLLEIDSDFEHSQRVSVLMLPVDKFKKWYSLKGVE